MDSDRLNRWLTLGANLGVLVGLVVLIVEIGQNTEMMRAQIVQARADTIMAAFDAQINNEFWPEIAAKRSAANSTEEWVNSLSPVDYERVRMSYLKDVNYLQHLFYQFQEGYIPHEIWSGPVRRQFIRYLELAKIFGQNCARAEPFYSFVRELANKEGTSVCGDDGRWRPLTETGSQAPAIAPN